MVMIMDIIMMLIVVTEMISFNGDHYNDVGSIVVYANDTKLLMIIIINDNDNGI